MESFAKPTQKDIAKKLGVSVSLVSRVLSGQGEKVGISQARIKAVMDAARECDYVPLSAALALKGKKTRTLGVVVYDFHDPFFGKLIAELQTYAHTRDYSLVVVGFVNRVPEASDLAPLFKHFVDGIIILGSFGDLNWLDKFRNIPIMRVGRGEDSRISFSVGVDESDAARQIVEHLKGIGKRHFRYVARDMSVHELRWKAAEAAAKEAGCSMTRFERKSFENDFLAGVAAGAEDFSADEVDAFICSTDVAAMGVIKSLVASGKKIPEDVAVVGFDDIASAEYFIPSITSVRQPVELFAKRVIDFVSDKTKPGEFCEKATLVVRESTAG